MFAFRAPGVTRFIASAPERTRPVSPDPARRQSGAQQPRLPDSELPKRRPLQGNTNAEALDATGGSAPHAEAEGQKEKARAAFAARAKVDPGGVLLSH